MEGSMMHEEDHDERRERRELSIAVFLSHHGPKLCAVDFQMFSCVRNSWRLCAAEQKKYFMQNQLPLILNKPNQIPHSSPSARPENDRSCYLLYSGIDGRSFKPLGIIDKSLKGFLAISQSCGYVLMEHYNARPFRCNNLTCDQQSDLNQIWVVNPFAGKEYLFRVKLLDARHILIKRRLDVERLALVAFSRSALHFCDPGDESWTCIEYDRNNLEVVDMVVYQGKLLFLGSKGEIGKLNLGSQLPIEVLGGPNPEISAGNLYLVVCGEKLLMLRVDYSEETVKFEVYCLQEGQWKEVSGIGENTLYVDEQSGCHSLRKPIGSFVQVKTNCIFYIDLFGAYCYCMDDKSTITVPVPPVRCYEYCYYLYPPIWYFPHLAWEVDAID